MSPWQWWGHLLCQTYSAKPVFFVLQWYWRIECTTVSTAWTLDSLQRAWWQKNKVPLTLKRLIIDIHDGASVLLQCHINAVLFFSKAQNKRKLERQRKKKRCTAGPKCNLSLSNHYQWCSSSLIKVVNILLPSFSQQDWPSYEFVVTSNY